ncbi:4-diphosphocytidyl-2-C-methyl-D-erythritol kinase [Parvularcula dongshanensis]|uniref:4-diphosphocytidyl-2-C-methyl-D-erythritol kinase n=1 Tax=Parvularcula dongshanensis TaxID=1173995 RepID=A0A840I6G0_9PROT|nr:4-diphosphocytidyl-2-C-methyl-D-erythritol kinase [Parvularcula dongshanensis]
MSSLCVFPAIGDEVALGPASDDFALEVTGPFADDLKDVPSEENLVLRAARLLAGEVSVPPCRFRLAKRVPAASGLGGGTADAAAALCLLNEASEAPLPRSELIALSRELGADGPVCTAAALRGGGILLAEGDGDRVSPLGSAPPLFTVVSNPLVPVPTGAVFKRFDAAMPAAGLRQRLPGMGAAALVAAAARGRNDLRLPARTIAPIIGRVERDLSRAPGSLFARMSGSGASVFALFASPLDAARCARAERARGRWAEAAPLLRGIAGGA